MKTTKSIARNIVIVLSLALAFTSCDKWNLKGIKGEGSVVSENVDLDDVSGIILEIPATVYLTQEDEQSIKIEAQQNILDNIIKSINSDALKLRFDEDVSQCEAIKVYMTIQQLAMIDIRGSGEVNSNSEFESEDELDINISGSGDVYVDVNASLVNLDINGSGDISLGTECEDIYGTISGSGELKLTGNCTNYADFMISGSGDINAFNFINKSLDINTYGSGEAKVNVSDQLKVKIVGSGDVYYKGNPTLSVNISGSGEVINAN
jgi:hypothetical protein